MSSSWRICAMSAVMRSYSAVSEANALPPPASSTRESATPVMDFRIDVTMTAPWGLVEVDPALPAARRCGFVPQDIRIDHQRFHERGPYDQRTNCWRPDETG